MFKGHLVSTHATVRYNSTVTLPIDGNRPILIERRNGEGMWSEVLGAPFQQLSGRQLQPGVGNQPRPRLRHQLRFTWSAAVSLRR